MDEIEQTLLGTPTGNQWSKVGVRPHHGLVIPLFSLHSQSSCGIGEYTDLPLLFNWCREIGIDVIQLLPLNDPGMDTSPYAALSAFALNPIHIGLSSLPYLDEDLQSALGQLQALTSTQRVNYPLTRKEKVHFLRTYYQKYAAKFIHEAAFQNFKNTNDYWLKDYTLFKALKIHHKWDSWEDWPDNYKIYSPGLISHLPTEIQQEAEFQAFMQYLAFQQLMHAKIQAEQAGIFLKGDIPILINRDSADVWSHSALFQLSFAAGAPPDMYAKEGQKWGFPVYNWEEMKTQDYTWWKERLKVASDFYHLFRLDHIVGFFRIWAIPIDLPSKEGFFLPQDNSTWIPHGETILRTMLESCAMLPIGEDLGTVPPEVRVCLHSLGICGTKVMRWERRWNEDRGFINPKDYLPDSMTTVSTHDSETLQQWWKNQSEEAELFARTFGLDYSPELTAEQRQAILHSSHHSGSLFHINLLQEYLALIPGMTWDNPDDERINVPSTVSDTNWSYRFRPSVEQIVASAPLKQMMQKTMDTGWTKMDR